MMKAINQSDNKNNHRKIDNRIFKGFEIILVIWFKLINTCKKNYAIQHGNKQTKSKAGLVLAT
jgi:hypothetical protein